MPFSISSRNTVTDTPRYLATYVWVPYGPVKLTLEINPHNSSEFISHAFELVTISSRKMVLSEGIHSTDVLGTILIT